MGWAKMFGLQSEKDPIWFFLHLLERGGDGQENNETRGMGSIWFPTNPFELRYTRLLHKSALPLSSSVLGTKREKLFKKEGLNKTMAGKGNAPLSGKKVKNESSGQKSLKKEDWAPGTVQKQTENGFPRFPYGSGNHSDDAIRSVKTLPPDLAALLAFHSVNSLTLIIKP